MRVYELGKELGTGSNAVIAAAAKLGIDATAPPSGLSDEEAVAIRAALGEAGGEVAEAAGAAVVAAAGSAGYRLVRKGSVTAGRTRVKKGQVVDERTFAALPGRVRGWFDQV